MLKFVERDRVPPEKRRASERRRDYSEVYREFGSRRAEEQASRCSQCGVPFCQSACPLGNDIPDWLKLVAENRLSEAYALSSATNSMPEICGRICPQDRLCEGACVIEQSGHGTVTIGAVEQFITETAWREGWIKPIAPPKELALSVGIVGAGPAGLAGAEWLRRRGIQATVYDRYDRVGGLLVYGIPNFKLEKAVVARRADHLRESGVRFVLNCEVGRDIALADLRAEHDAVLLATGAYKARELDCAGAEHPNVVPALEYLIACNRKAFGDSVPAFDAGLLNAEHKRVVVIGGGDTAMDCVRTAVRQGARSVICLYRRDRANMPGSAREVANAEEEGVKFEWLAGPLQIVGQAGEATKLTAIRMMLGDADATGRRAPVEIPGSQFELEADIIVKALGFEPENASSVFGEPELKITSRGAVRVNAQNLETSLSDVYAAGDAVRGASLVVWAVRDGQIAAENIARKLTARARLAAE